MVSKKSPGESRAVFLREGGGSMTLGLVGEGSFALIRRSRTALFGINLDHATKNGTLPLRGEGKEPEAPLVHPCFTEKKGTKEVVR